MTLGEIGLGLALALDYVIVLALIPRIVAQRREAKATLAWVFFVLLVPYLGLIAFWALGTTRFRLRKRRAGLRAPPGMAALEVGGCRGEEGYPCQPSRLSLTRSLGARDPQPGNAVEVYWEGPRAFEALLSAIESAQHHVHLQTYIYRRDETGVRVRDALTAAARRGVEVRVLLDDVGAWSTPRAFFRDLRHAGGKAARFLPVSLVSRRLSINHRNHRKLVVVDGLVGLIGGMNVGDEYAGLDQPWRDAHVRLEGPAVLGIQEIFVKDWYAATREDLASAHTFPAPCLGAEAPGSSWVQILESGPDEGPWHAIHALLLHAITNARQRVWLATPYFAPDQALELALHFAALRGVDVRLLLPGRTDHPLVRWAGHSFYPELLRAGARLFELHDAFLHAKLVLIDDDLASIGSANLDERSLALNFEANAFFHGQGVSEVLESHFASLQGESREVDAATFAARPRRQRAREALSRLLAPVL